MALLIVGSIALDSVQTPFGSNQDALGGSAVFFSHAASLLHPVRVVGVVGDDYPEAALAQLAAKGIDLGGVERRPGESFRWSGKYSYDLQNRETLETRLGVFAEFQPQIPQGFRDSDYVFLGNIDPLLQRQVLSQVNQPKLVACDTMNYWIDGHFQSLQETLKKVHILLINEAEARQLAHEPNLVRAARKILSWGPHTLVVKRGEYGVVMFQGKPAERALRVFGAPAYPLENVFDPTGAGDTFAGGVIGFLAGSGRTDPQAMRQAIIVGSVMASFNVEKFSLDRLKELTFTEVSLRFREFKEMTQFEDFPDFGTARA